MWKAGRKQAKIALIRQKLLTPAAASTTKANNRISSIN